VEVGTVIECEHHETEEAIGTITVAAIGQPFELGKKKTGWVYLYTQIPVASAAQTVATTETPDEPLERLAHEHARELGRTGELPGA